MRNPQKLWCDLGPCGFFVFQMVVGGAVLAALVHGVFFGVLVQQLVSGLFWSEKAGAFDVVLERVVEAEPIRVAAREPLRPLLARLQSALDEVAAGADGA